MSKQKIIIPNNFYNITQREYDNYHSLIFNNDSKLKISSLLSSSNQEVVINFDNKKDKRRTNTKSEKFVSLYFSPILNSSSTAADLSFIQNKTSETFFNVNISNSQSAVLNNNNNTFTFRGNLSKITLNSPSFNNFIIEQYAQENPELKSSTNHLDIDLYGNNCNKSLSVISPNMVSLDTIECNTLENIDFHNCSRVSFSIDQLHTPKLKTLVFDNVAFINLQTSSYALSPLTEKSDPFSFSNIKIFETQLKEFYENINKDCKIKLSPSTIIFSSTLIPEIKDTTSYTEAHGLTVKELFPNSEIKNGFIETTPINLIKACWNIKKQYYMDRINNVDSVFEKQETPLDYYKKEVKDVKK